MILAVADYAEAEHAHRNPLPPVPQELLWGLRSERWGLPSGRGWLHERVMLFTQMTTALHYYKAVIAWKNSRDWITFQKKSPELYQTILHVLKLRGQDGPKKHGKTSNRH